MKIIELITLAENKLAALNQAMATAHRKSAIEYLEKHNA